MERICRSLGGVRVCKCRKTFKNPPNWRWRQKRRRQKTKKPLKVSSSSVYLFLLQKDCYSCYISLFLSEISQSDRVWRNLAFIRGFLTSWGSWPRRFRCSLQSFHFEVTQMLAVVVTVTASLKKCQKSEGKALLKHWDPAGHMYCKSLCCQDSIRSKSKSCCSTRVGWKLRLLPL